MNGQHGRLILQLSKAMSILSHKIYTDVLSENDVSKDYNLFDLLRQCKSEISKVDDRDLVKIANLVQKEISS